MRGLKFHMLHLLIFGLFVFRAAEGQNTRYTHPLYDISFEASANWKQVLREVNGKEYRLTHPNHNMSICLSYVPECRHPKRYLKRISGAKGLISPGGYYDTVLNDQVALILRGCCVKGKRPYQNLFVGFPVDEGLYLVEITCPLDCSFSHQERIKAILETVVVGEPSHI